MQNPDRQCRQPSRSSLVCLRAIAVGFAAPGILSIAACSPDSVSAPPEARAPRLAPDVVTTATEQLLYQQAPVAGTNLFAPTAYESVADFTVPEGASGR